MTRRRIERLSAGLTAMVMCFVCLFLPVLSAQGTTKTWTNVMYLGGAVGVRGKSMVWDNVLTVSPDAIKLARKDSVVIFEIRPSSVQGLTYSGQRHANDGAVIAGAAAGLAGMLLGSTIKSTDHYVILEYTLPNGSQSAVLLRLHKDNQREILDALRSVTNISG